MARDCRRIRNGSHGGTSCILPGVGVGIPKTFPWWRFPSMRSSWRRASRVEKRFENWLEEHHQRRVLAGETTPTGSCPGEPFLRQLARRSKQIRLSDPRVEHAANCRICMNRLLAIRGENRSRLQKLAFSPPLSLAWLFSHWSSFDIHGNILRGIWRSFSRTVNLWDASTIRGQQPSLQSAFLPASIVRLTVILHASAGRVSMRSRSLVIKMEMELWLKASLRRSVPATKRKCQSCLT